MRALIMAFKILLIILGVWMVVASFGLLAAHLGGHVKRAYAVTSAAQRIEIGGEQKSAGEWAEEFRPEVTVRSTNFTPPLLKLLYEVIEQDDVVTFVYYQVWEDEIHPNPLYHKAYRLFRAAYYGSPVRDIEYFEVNVNRTSGAIEQLMFETSPGADYNVRLSEHLIAYVTRAESGDYFMRLTRKNGDPFGAQAFVPVQFEKQHILIGPVTWNHLTVLVDPNDRTYDRRFFAPLAYLTDETYASMKFVRKSQGTFQTVEKGVGAAAGLFGMAAIAIPLGLMMRVGCRIKKKVDRQSKPIGTLH